MEWGAEEYVDVELARELVASQFAPLPRRSVALLSEGWDYVVYRVDDDWAFRFPRRAVVVPGTERELAVLPLLGERLPLAVPVPVHVGRPDQRFPWPFYGAPFIPGVEAGDAQLSDDDRTQMARPLARALRALHAPATYAVVGGVLPADPIRRADMGVRVPRTREAIEGVVACHGDLHFRQLLVDRSGLSGIIDWVDVCRSDPGVDLQIAWSFLPSAGRTVFLEEYGPVSEESLLRARVLALFLSAILARYGRTEGLLSVETEALAGLRRTLSP